MAASPSAKSANEPSPTTIEGELVESPRQVQEWRDDARSEETSPRSGVFSPIQPPKVATPLQKRRRVTRACDECRRKKIKCDGKQPCTHCTVYSYECTYDQPSNRRRNPAPQYIEALEKRLQRAESLLKSVMPDVDLDDPKHGTPLPPRPSIIGHTPNQGTPADANTQNGSDVVATESDTDSDPRLDSMIEIFLRRMRQQFGTLFGRELEPVPGMAHNKFSTYPFMNDSSPLPGSSPVENAALGGSGSGGGDGDGSSNSSGGTRRDLPSKACAKQLCDNALDIACALMRFVHKPTFFERLNRVYSTPVENLTLKERRFLPLLYSCLSVGCLFSHKEKPVSSDTIYGDAISQGFTYFRAARGMMDVCDCRDLQSLQAIIFMIFFLQSSARLSTCYSYVGVALRAALKMGLHRSISTQFDPVERECRKRTFWVIRMVDVYVSALIGLPQILNPEDIDQELPAEVDDEYITRQEILPMAVDRVSALTATNAQIRLIEILQKVMKYIYPIKSLDTIQGKSSQSYSISQSKIREIELDLQNWMESLPMALRPGDDSPPYLKRVQQLLRMSYAHVQMILYRPFLHYVSQGNFEKDKRAFPCAAACVSVSRNIVHITVEMKRRSLLVGAYWFAMYTTFFAILSLVFYVLENPDKPTSREILKDALEGRDTLASLSARSLAADRCSKFLSKVFAELPERLRGSCASSFPTKRRRTAPPPQQVAPSATESVQGASDVSQASTPDIAGPKRASTFPKHVTGHSVKRASAPEDMHSFRANVQAKAQAQAQIQAQIKAQIKAQAKSHSRQRSNEAFTPSEFGPSTPNSASSLPISSAPTPNMFQYQLQNQANGNVADLTSIVFPSSNPFAYPNQQPIMMLETQQPNFDYNTFLPASASTPITTFDSSMGPQNFGLAPSSYMMPEQQVPVFDDRQMADAMADAMMGVSPSDMHTLQQQYSQVAGIDGDGSTDDLLDNWHTNWPGANFQQE